jgi:hypothetical protein
LYVSVNSVDVIEVVEALLGMTGIEPTRLVECKSGDRSYFIVLLVLERGAINMFVPFTMILFGSDVKDVYFHNLREWTCWFHFLIWTINLLFGDISL